MSQALLDRILDKATRECQVGGVSLYNWAEPLLNPDLPALIRAVNGHGLRSLISSNLNILPDPEKLMRANPSWFRVSVSGFQQEIYARGHRHGKIEEVKANMRHLSEAKSKTGATTTLEIFYHRYIDNEADEVRMKTFAEDLGYEFVTAWAFMTPAEKVLTYTAPDQPLAILSNEDHASIVPASVAAG